MLSTIIDYYTHNHLLTHMYIFTTFIIPNAYHSHV